MSFTDRYMDTSILLEQPNKVCDTERRGNSRAGPSKCWVSEWLRPGERAPTYALLALGLDKNPQKTNCKRLQKKSQLENSRRRYCCDETLHFINLSAKASEGRVKKSLAKSKLKWLLCNYWQSLSYKHLLVTTSCTQTTSCILLPFFPPFFFSDNKAQKMMRKNLTLSRFLPLEEDFIPLAHSRVRPFVIPVLLPLSR